MGLDQIERPPASRRTLFAILGGSVAAAAVLLVCIVLPAEYGIDPLGTGKALGLTGLAGAPAPVAAERAAAPTTAAAPAAAPVDGAAIVPVLQKAPVESRWGEAASVTGAFIAQAEPVRLDSREITLAPFEGMEIKYHMRKGAGLVYSWTASAPVLYDFHGQPDVAPADAPKTDEDYFESYDHDDTAGKRAFRGTLVAPSTGIQGWFWENPSGDAVKIKLVAAGFFDWIYQNRGDEESRLKPMDADALASHPRVPDESL